MTTGPHQVDRAVDAEKSTTPQDIPANAQDDRGSTPSSSKHDDSSSELEKKPEGDPTARDADKPRAGMGDYFRIFTFAEPLSRVLYALAVVASIGSGATLPLMAIIFGNFTSDFNDFMAGGTEPQEFRNFVDDFVLWFIWLFIGRFALVYIASVSAAIASLRTTRNIRKRFLEATLRQEVWHFDKAANGSVANQVTTNGNRINIGTAEKFAALVQGISLFFSSFVVALAIQWKLALITMSIVPAIFVVTGVFATVETKSENKIIRVYSRAGVLAQEAISSIKTIHAFWAHDKLVGKYDEYLKIVAAIGKKKSKNWGILFACEWFFVLCGNALAFWQGYRMYASGEIPNVGTVMTVVLAVTLGASAMSTIAPQLEGITNATSAAAELYAIIDKKSLLDPLSTEGKAPATCTGDIKIRGLEFSYPSRPTARVLRGLDLDIPAGKTTALVGQSGCGKSTLVGLLERWYLPGGGSILLDGVDLAEYNTHWLRSNIRLVQQEPVLFRGTVYENVIKGLVGDQVNLSEEKKRELVADACRQSNAHDFITRLPEGYDTQVGERASMLSGGQRQRVAIARSIISNPQILLLDEATSALDPRAEGIVQDALNKVSVNKTTLVIAHKLSTIKTADNIVVMAMGEVVEQGTHQQLIDQGGAYAALVRAQDLGDAQSKTKEYEEGSASADDEVELTRTKTVGQESSLEAADAEVKRLTSGTLGYSLISCVFKILREHFDLWPWMVAGAIGSLIGGVTYVAQALLFSRLINIFTLDVEEGQSEANFFALMIFIVAIANFIGYFAIGYSCNEISQPVQRRYRRELFRRMLYMDQDFFDRPEHTSGALASKLSTVPTSLQELIGINLFLILTVLINVLSSSILAIAYGWQLGLVVVFGGMTVLVGAGWLRVVLDRRMDEHATSRFTHSAGIATEAVTSIRTVASLTLERSLLDEYNEVLEGVVRRNIRMFLYSMVAYALSQSLDLLVMALGFWYGSRLIADGTYTAEQFFIIFIAAVFGGQAAGQFFVFTTSMTKAAPAANYILWLRTIEPRIGENESNADKGPDPASSKGGAIDLKDIDFRYTQRDSARVLRGINMQLAKGSYNAACGPSGCGKSTLINLLERFYDPTSGTVSLDNVDIRTFSPKRYRAHVALVQQEPTLFQGTVSENVSLGLSQPATQEQIYNALRQANAYDFVKSLPEGLETPCGGRGMQFSGGQRQRLAIARALIKAPSLLLLDEATSALDTQSERLVQQTLDEAASKGERTTMAVAHRLSTIKHADRIFVFGDGKIMEVGTHEELLSRRGRYWEMCQAQSLDRAA